MKLKLLIISLLMAPMSSFGIGIGMTLGSGAEEWDDTCCTSDTYDHSGDRELSHFGLVLDSAVAKDRIFNYRFSLVGEENNVEDDGNGLQMTGVAFIHDFGFALFKNERVRIWMGPRIKLSFYDELEQTGAPNSQEEADGEVVGFGVGPVFGVNFHLPRVVTFALSFGVMASTYDGDYDAWNPIGTINSNSTVEADSTGSFFNFSVIFRIRDNY